MTVWTGAAAHAWAPLDDRSNGAVCRVWPEDVLASRQRAMGIEPLLPLDLARRVVAFPEGDNGGVTEFRIRAGIQADLPVLRDIYRRASLSNAGTQAALLAHPEVLLLTDDGIREGRTRVVTAAHHVVGFATTLRVGTVLELEDLFVDPGWMRRGVGHRLVREVVAVAEREHVQRVEVTANPHALAFYEKAGFVHDGEVETRFGAGVRMHVDA